MSTQEQSLTVREAQQLAPHQALSETVGQAAAAQVQARVAALYKMAIARPRDMDQVRVTLLKECSRPGFAQAARYAKPVGGRSIEGWSIRFVEAALLALGNVNPDVAVVFEDSERRLMRVTLTDMERNVTYTQDVSIEKTVERNDAKGREVVGQRANAQGRPVYIVKATEDELLNKQNALISKALRTHGLRIIPADILDEAAEQCARTRHGEITQDPDAARKKIIDAFSRSGVDPAALKEYLGHDVASCSPAEIDNLRMVYTAIRDGETTWHETITTRRAERAPVPESPPSDKKGAAALKLGDGK